MRNTKLTTQQKNDSADDQKLQQKFSAKSFKQEFFNFFFAHLTFSLDVNCWLYVCGLIFGLRAVARVALGRSAPALLAKVILTQGVFATIHHSEPQTSAKQSFPLSFQFDCFC